MRIYGIIRFYDIGGNLMYERMYKYLSERGRIINDLSSKKNIHYYQIEPFAKYWVKNLTPDKRNNFIRPRAVYDNNKSLYAK